LSAALANQEEAVREDRVCKREYPSLELGTNGFQNGRAKMRVFSLRSWLRF
jgi:hypothetical protein